MEEALSADTCPGELTVTPWNWRILGAPSENRDTLSGVVGS